MRNVLLVAVVAIAVCFAFQGEVKATGCGFGGFGFGGYGVSGFNTGFYPQSTFIRGGFNRQFVDKFGNVIVVDRFGRRQIIRRNFRGFNRFGARGFRGFGY